ncbi:hypothetical protein NL676_009789 [Syzygium grande]|nr:hypothetical protein NL676_009789 [Syzygium grande]
MEPPTLKLHHRSHSLPDHHQKPPGMATSKTTIAALKSFESSDRHEPEGPPARQLRPEDPGGGHRWRGRVSGRREERIGKVGLEVGEEVSVSGFAGGCRGRGFGGGWVGSERPWSSIDRWREEETIT